MTKPLQIYEPPTAPEAGAPATSSGADLPELTQDASLEAVLAAWHDATVRLEKTHELLQTEVSRLTDELEEKNRELARQNRLADIGRMASHVAHEVRNSLVPVTLYMSLLKRRLADDPASMDILAKVEAGFTALNVTVNDLLNFTSHREPHWNTFSVRDLVEEVCDSVGPQLEAQSIRTAIDVAYDTRLSADREMFRRAVLNLVLNALDVMTKGGELVITSYEGPEGFELEIADSGPGIERQRLPKLFEPFYTTKSSGTGLGLAVVQRIAETHGGRVSVANCPEGGAAFTLSIPRRAVRVAA